MTSKLSIETEGKITSLTVDGVAWQPVPPPIVVPPALNGLERLVYCGKGPHEAQPHGVPPWYSWAIGPQVQQPLPGANKATTVWGQAYLILGKTLPTNSRVEVRKMAIYALAGGKWTQLQQVDEVQGDSYVEDFSGNASLPIRDLRHDPVTGYASAKLIDGHNFHFWPAPWPRPALPAGTIGIYSTVQARLIPDDPTKPLDGAGRIIGNVGADWYETVTSYVAAGGTQPGVGSGRFIVLTDKWQALDFCSLDEAHLRATPPTSYPA